MQVEKFESFNLIEDLLPHERYKQVLVEAAVGADLSAEWIERLRTMPCREYRPYKFSDEDLAIVRGTEISMDEIKNSRVTEGDYTSGMILLDGVVILMENINRFQVHAMWYLTKDITLRVGKMVSFDPLPEKREDFTELQNTFVLDYIDTFLNSGGRLIGHCGPCPYID